MFLLSNPVFSQKQIFIILGINVVDPILSFFCVKIIRVVLAMLTIAIKNLEKHLKNSNLIIKKSAICFKSVAQKRKTDNQTSGALYYKYWESFS